MLTPMDEAHWAQYDDKAWFLAQALNTSSFPTYLDGCKTRDDFEDQVRSTFMDSHKTLLMYEEDGAARGWVQAFCIAEEQYAQINLFLTEEGWQAPALNAFLTWAKREWPGMRLDVGFPAENTRACEWLSRHGFERMESSILWMRHGLETAQLPDAPGVRLMGERDEPLFRRLHCDETVYWTAQRVLEEKHLWHVYLYGQTVALLATRGTPMAEVFSIDFAGPDDPNAYFALLTACLRGAQADGAAHVCFLEERDGNESALVKLGFEKICRYEGYTAQL